MTYVNLLSNFAFNSNLRHYTEVRLCNEGSHRFVIRDAAADGICCGQGFTLISIQYFHINIKPSVLAQLNYSIIDDLLKALKWDSSSGL